MEKERAKGNRERERERRESAYTPAGQKRVKGPLRTSLSTISSSSLTSARKLDDVSNYPAQKPPFRGIQHTPVPGPAPRCPAAGHEDFLNAHLRTVVSCRAPRSDRTVPEGRNSFPSAKSSQVSQMLPSHLVFLLLAEPTTQSTDGAETGAIKPSRKSRMPDPRSGSSAILSGVSRGSTPS